MCFLKPTFLLLVSTLLIISCSSDDGPGEPDFSQVIGNYTLSAVNVSPDQDVNEDGTASTNLLDEMTCITGTLNVNADKSWSLSFTRINVTTITGGLFFIDCGDANTSSGTWTYGGNQLSLNGSFEPTLYLLNGEILSRQIGDDLPGFRSVSFTKQ